LNILWTQVEQRHQQQTQQMTEGHAQQQQRLQEKQPQPQPRPLRHREKNTDQQNLSIGASAVWVEHSCPTSSYVEFESSFRRTLTHCERVTGKPEVMGQGGLLVRRSCDLGATLNLGQTQEVYLQSIGGEFGHHTDS
jgi:hypothetical protein